MGDAWGPPTDWDQESETPYIHWWRTKEGDRPEHADFDTIDVGLEAEGSRSAKLKLPLPGYAKNPGAFTRGQDQDVVQKLTPDVIGDVPKETVLIGVIDTGIPLGHRRTRFLTGKTRFISSWQQNASFQNQSYLPFGRELYAADIDALLTQHSPSGLQGGLDEVGFNLDAGLIDPVALSGDRELDYRHTHGAHILDLAAGHDPLFATDDTAQDPIQNSRIISVNLPPQKVHGTAGNFLTVYAALAIERILHIADALWKAQHGAEAGGYPLVLNFSFGKNAGPKDGNSVWEKVIEDMIVGRNRRAATRLVMPAGNENLLRGNARKLLGPEGSLWKKYSLTPDLEVPLVVNPADQTSNFVEIWSMAQRSKDMPKDQEVQEAAHADFRLFVTPPGHSEQEVRDLNTPGKYCDIGTYGRVYCYTPYGQPRPHFVIGIAPTMSFDDTSPTAPAGVWKIRLRYTGQTPQEVTFGVQTDLSGIRHSKSGLRSYFDHPDYARRLETGRVRDSYVDRAVLPVKYTDGHCELWQDFGPVQRKGSQNALASWPTSPKDESAKKGVFTVVGGYRLSDGMPTVYSSTFDGIRKKGQGRETPTALYPSDDSPSHFGLLAAGSRDGTAVALQGTSMAAALATRDMARAMSEAAQSGDSLDTINESWVIGRAQALQDVNKLKSGHGMVAYPGIGRVPRHGRR